TVALSPQAVRHTTAVIAISLRWQSMDLPGGRLSVLGYRLRDKTRRHRSGSLHHRQYRELELKSYHPTRRSADPLIEELRRRGWRTNGSKRRQASRPTGQDVPPWRARTRTAAPGAPTSRPRDRASPYSDSRSQ